jgi:hypothetical protein
MLKSNVDHARSFLDLLYIALEVLKNIGECPHCESCRTLAKDTSELLTERAEEQVQKFQSAVKELNG